MLILEVPVRKQTFKCWLYPLVTSNLSKWKCMRCKQTLTFCLVQWHNQKSWKDFFVVFRNSFVWSVLLMKKTKSSCEKNNFSQKIFQCNSYSIDVVCLKVKLFVSQKQIVFMISIFVIIYTTHVNASCYRFWSDKYFCEYFNKFICIHSSLFYYSILLILAWTNR